MSSLGNRFRYRYQQLKKLGLSHASAFKAVGMQFGQVQVRRGRKFVKLRRPRQREK